MINAPQLLDECGWSCAEAVELSQLTEKITNHFCFRKKRIFRDYGVSEQERETFCSQLQEVRQVRNLAVHRVTPGNGKLLRYEKIVRAIVGLLMRIGGHEFWQQYSDRVSKLFEYPKDTETNKVA